MKEIAVGDRVELTFGEDCSLGVVIKISRRMNDQKVMTTVYVVAIDGAGSVHAYRSDLKLIGSLTAEELLTHHNPTVRAVGLLL